MITGKNPGSSITVDSFQAALDFFQETARRYPERNLLFRGHANNKWRVVPSLFRQSPDISQFESDMVRDLISQFPNEFINDQSMFDRLVRMQHYGLPTRLLDVTNNPLVALYFAVDPDQEDDENSDGAVVIFAGTEGRHKFYDSDVVSCMANLANLKNEEREILANSKARTIDKFNELQAADRLVQFIKSEKPYFTPRIQRVDLFRPVTVTPKRSNQRMHAQSGKFIVFGLEAKNGPKYERDNTMVKMTIKGSAKAEVRDRLDELGIDESSLFPEIDKAARRISQRYRKKALA